MLSGATCRFVLIKRRCKPCRVTLYPGFSKSDEVVTRTEASDVESLPYDDAENEMDDHLDANERGTRTLAAPGGKHTTVHEYFAAEIEALNSPSTCPFAFLRVTDNLWMHINFVETEIHLPVRSLHNVCVWSFPL